MLENPLLIDYTKMTNILKKISLAELKVVSKSNNLTCFKGLTRHFGVCRVIFAPI